MLEFRGTWDSIAKGILRQPLLTLTILLLIVTSQSDSETAYQNHLEGLPKHRLPAPA